MLDFFLSAPEESVARAARSMDELCSFLVQADMKGPATALNQKGRHFHGLSFAPLLIDKWRGHFAEWLLLRILEAADGTASHEDRRDLSQFRQLLRRLRLGMDGEGPESAQAAGSGVAFEIDIVVDAARRTGPEPSGPEQ